MQSHSAVWVHVVWSTHKRSPVLTPEIRNALFDHIMIYAQQHQMIIDRIGGYVDHIHILCRINATISIAELVNRLKGESSFWLNRSELIKGKFTWQSGYGAFSVSRGDLERARKYIEEQAKHHRKVSFREELDSFLSKRS